MANIYTTNTSSNLSINSKRSRLPPKISSQKRPSSVQTQHNRQSKRSSSNRNGRGGERGANASLAGSWDCDVNSLSVESTPIPLTARGHIMRSITPSRATRSWNNPHETSLMKANSLTNLSSGRQQLPSSFATSSHSEIHLRSFTDLEPTHDRRSPHINNNSNNIDQLSDEIEDIIREINEGIILNTSALEDTLSSNNNPLSCNGDDTCQQHVSYHQQEEEDKGGKDNILHQLTPLHIAEPAVISSHNIITSPVTHATSSLHDTVGHSTLSCNERREIAAVKIQGWYREKRNAKCTKEQLQKLLSLKKEEIKAKLQETSLNEEQIKMEEKQARREAKMKAARHEAIEALKQKREEKRKETEQIVKEEMISLEARGKVKKKSHKQKVTNGNQNVSNSNKVVTNGNQEVSNSNKVVTNGNQEVSNSNKVVTNGNQEDSPLKEKDIKQTSDNAKPDDNSSQVDEFFKAGPRKLTPRTSPSHVSPSQNHTSTMDSIFATLKELEEAPPPLPGVAVPPPTSPAYLSAINLQKLPDNEPNGKLQGILTYLDEIEQTAHITSCPLHQEGGEGGGAKVEIDEQIEAASAVANDVTTAIMTQRMELDNKNKTIDMLQKALTQQRELTVYHAKEMEKESQKRLEIHKEEYEGTIQRHQCFIDQLIDDKKVLSDKCQQLINEIKETNKKYKTNITTMEDNHATELEKQKQTYIAAEKLRKEKWKAEETQRIKEATVKSLEPEIQRIIAKGKAEVQKLKALHESELLRADEKVSKRFLQQIEEMRDQHANEKEMACQHERELARQKYEQMAEQEEKSYQQLRKKLYNELQQERDKMNAEINGHNGAIEKQMKELKEGHNIELSKIRTEHEAILQDIRERHNMEMKELHERNKIEKQMWEENYLKKQDAILMTKEREMRERLRQERDMEIETVIHKLESETAAVKEESDRAAESRIKRIRDKYETELKEVEKSEKNTLQKFNSMKVQVTELESQVIKLRSQLRLKEEEVNEVNEIATRLTRERDQFADVVRQEFSDQLVRLEQENREVKMEMTEIISKHKFELERLQRNKERELSEVHERVKHALTKKEENHKALKAQHESALRRADHLEMLLEQQRKELLKK